MINEKVSLIRAVDKIASEFRARTLAASPEAVMKLRAPLRLFVHLERDKKTPMFDFMGIRLFSFVLLPNGPRVAATFHMEIRKRQAERVADSMKSLAVNKFAWW